MRKRKQLDNILYKKLYDYLYIDFRIQINTKIYWYINGETHKSTDTDIRWMLNYMLRETRYI